MKLLDSIARRLLALSGRHNIHYTTKIIYTLLKNSKNEVKDIESVLQALLSTSGIGCGGGVGTSGEEVMLEILPLLKSNECVIFDVGANVGSYTTMLLESICLSKERDAHLPKERDAGGGGGNLPLITLRQKIKIL